MLGVGVGEVCIQIAWRRVVLHEVWMPCYADVLQSNWNTGMKVSVE